MSTINPDYRTAIHFQPLASNSNVRCLNGSAHVFTTRDINEVTCEQCLNPETAKEFCQEKERDELRGS